jgi:hypothetical protein
MAQNPQGLVDLNSRAFRYVANVPGNDAYFYAEREKLEQLNSQQGTGTIWFTLSAADNYWEDFHRLFDGRPLDPVEEAQWKRNNVIQNPHLIDALFTERTDQLVKHLFAENCLKVRVCLSVCPSSAPLIFRCPLVHFFNFAAHLFYSMLSTQCSVQADWWWLRYEYQSR